MIWKFRLWLSKKLAGRRWHEVSPAHTHDYPGADPVRQE